MIETIEVYRVTLELRVPFTTSFGTSTAMTRPFVVVRTSDGLTGVGEIPTLNEPVYKPECDTAAAMTSLREYLLPGIARYQRNEGRIESISELLNSYAWVKGAVFAKSGIESALWDIEAQRAGAPLWKLWGGERTDFPVGVSIGGKTVDGVLGLAEHAASLGYGRFKVKIWPGFDLQVVRALRDRYPDIMLQVDANSAYDRSTAGALKALDNFDLLLIEQPLYDDDIVLHSELSREIETPICLDESIHSLRDTEAAIGLWRRNDNLHRLIVNIKPPRVSGFTEAMAIAHHCRAAGVKTWIGGMLDSAWGKAANLNFNALAAIDLPGDHFSPSGAYFVKDVASPELAAPAGTFKLGNGTSTGLTFDWDAFAELGTLEFTQDCRL